MLPSQVNGFAESSCRACGEKMIPVIRDMAPVLPQVLWTSRFAAYGKIVGAMRHRKEHQVAESGDSCVTDMKIRPRLINKPARSGIGLHVDRPVGSDESESSARIMPARDVGPTSAGSCQHCLIDDRKGFSIWGITYDLQAPRSKSETRI